MAKASRRAEWLTALSAHCGCYHQRYPGRMIQIHHDAIDEPPWVPLTVSPGPRAMWLAAGTHFVTAITPATQGGVALRSLDHDVLRSLPFDSRRRRGIFGNDGIIAGTERAERVVLWLRGVPAPGAMRSRGHHATVIKESRLRSIRPLPGWGKHSVPTLLG